MELRWDVNKQYGFLDIQPRDYDEAYFNKYQKYAETEMGKKLNDHRLDFVARNYLGNLLDVGVGSLQFVLSRDHTFGFDVNPVAIQRLTDLHVYADPREIKFAAYSFFDSFEHIKDPSPMLDGMESGVIVFMSIPSFKDVNHVLRSKHFRPDEHFWYFTPQGLIRFMLDHGFVCIDIDNFEIRVGREDIMSFAFKKL
jgi:hypothetical protein